MGWLLGCQASGNLESTELGEGESHIEDSQCYRGDLLGGEMHPHEVMQHPVGIESALESFAMLGIGIGAAAIAGKDASESRVKGFEMVGVNVRFKHVLSGLGVFLLGCLVFGTLGTFLVGLGAFVLDAHFDSLLQRGRGTSDLPRSDHFLTDVKQAVAIPTFSICHQSQILGLLDDIGQRPDRLFKERLRLLATSQLPDEARSTIHQHDGPAFRLLGWSVLMHSGIQFISFNKLLQELMAQRIQQQDFLERTQTLQLAREAVLADVERPARCVDPHPIVEGMQDRADSAQRSAESF